MHYPLKVKPDAVILNLMVSKIPMLFLSQAYYCLVCLGLNTVCLGLFNFTSKKRGSNTVPAITANPYFSKNLL